MAGKGRLRRSAFWALIALSGLVVAAALFVLAVNLLIVHDARAFIVKSPEAAPSAAFAIVLGAGVKPDGTPTPMLKDRLDTAVILYREGKVKTLLLSGDGRPGDNEVAVMQRYLAAQGVPAGDMLTDPGGLNTYDSMFRAHTDFRVQSALIPTQSFHLTRAVYLARSLRITAIGVPADIQHYSTVEDTVREWAARVKAFVMIHS
jgi:SanA protein